jgi:hypothetical protein
MKFARKTGNSLWPADSYGDVMLLRDGGTGVYWGYGQMSRYWGIGGHVFSEDTDRCHVTEVKGDKPILFPYKAVVWHCIQCVVNFQKFIIYSNPRQTSSRIYASTNGLLLLAQWSLFFYVEVFNHVGNILTQAQWYFYFKESIAECSDAVNAGMLNRQTEFPPSDNSLHVGGILYRQKRLNLSGGVTCFVKRGELNVM